MTLDHDDVEAIAQLLRERSLPEISHLTPHTPRRTFASILAECGVPPRRAMYLLGHTDSSFTMRVYQQVLDMGQGAVELLEEVLGARLEEVCSTYSGSGVWQPIGTRHKNRR